MRKTDNLLITLIKWSSFLLCLVIAILLVIWMGYGIFYSMGFFR